MIRFVFRVLGLFALAAAFVAVLYDGTKAIAANELSVTSFSQIWTALSAASLRTFEASVARHAPPWVWDPLMSTVLTAPAALVLAILGALFLLLGRKKKALIGYSR